MEAFVKPELGFLAFAASGAFVLGVSVGAANAAELISNGGFEAGTFTADSSFPTYDTISSGDPAQDLSSWTVTQGSLVWGFNATDINTHSGQGFVDLTGIGDNGNHGTISQTIATIAGQTYTFSIYTTLDFGQGGIVVDDNGNAISLSGAYGSWNETPTGATWGLLSGTFVANGASTTIDIAGIPGRTFMIGLDDVSVTGPALVPEPATWAMMAFGFAGLAFAGYRTRHATRTTS
jgi:hypothetical protein